MAIINDRITRFVRDHDLPVVCFGFGDCTGGAQASLMTHPLVLTYYFSGTNMPFAGQIVVPSHLPLTATLSNYLSTVPGAMQGLLRHPFAEGLDDEMRQIDARIPVAEETVEEVLARVLEGRLRREVEEVSETELPAPATFRPIRRTLVHARGCTAVKLLRTTRRLGIDAVLVQSDPDMESVASTMLGERDSLVCLGGSTPDESYLNAHSVVHIAEREGVDSLHPGIGFLSESSAFADLCRRHGLNFIGPSVSSMEMMGNKSNAIQTARKLDIPVVPGSHGIVTDMDAARAVAETIGFPVIIKAVHGGGGKGIRVVRRGEEFRDAFLQITAEARSAFGNGDCYIEKCIVSLRHVEVQVLRDRFGNTRVLGLRDCSVQRNNQKLVEESGSTALPDEARDAAFRYAEAIADEIDYVGAGTVEFIYDLESRSVYFMEMNTRLQVEHPVTEMASRADIVKAQFDIAAGESLESLVPDPRGYAIEVRINAEKAVLQSGGGVSFAPDPGTVVRCHLPARDDVAVIAAIAEGSVVPPYYDSLVVQIVAWGQDRDAAIERLVSYLDEVRIEGIATNVPLYRRILTDEVFRGGEYDTRYLSQFLARTDVRGLVAEIEQAVGKGSQRLELSTIAIDGSDELKVVAPSPGVFYLTPTPNEPDLARVGDLVSSDQVLCLIEAMKMFQPLSLSSFNEEGELYPSDCSYEIVRVNPANAQAVNKGDLLFVVRPRKIA
jgi:acetyl/propionyl-CoA carboxylase alpha subunit